MDKLKLIRIVYTTAAGWILIVGLFFSYLIAKLDDAPGVIILGSAFTLGCSLAIYGIGEILITLKENNAMIKKNNGIEIVKRK